jgi:hypothetical protein
LVVLDVVGLPLMRCWHLVNLRSRPMTDAAVSLRGFISEFGNRFITRQFDEMLRQIYANTATPAPRPQ